jgi:hypothetical protein
MKHGYDTKVAHARRNTIFSGMNMGFVVHQARKKPKGSEIGNKLLAAHLLEHVIITGSFSDIDVLSLIEFPSVAAKQKIAE